jgi:hypothetical protein
MKPLSPSLLGASLLWAAAHRPEAGARGQSSAQGRLGGPAMSGVLRDRNARMRASFGKPRDGTFEAHQPRLWTLSSTETGSHHAKDPRFKPVRMRPQSAHAMYQRNPAIRDGKLSSEVVGFQTGFKPMQRPRPAAAATIMLRNPVIRDGYVSSEPIGMHTGVAPRKTQDPAQRTHLPRNRRDRPQSAPIWRTTLRTSDAIGRHPPPEPPDLSDAAVMHFEAQFRHRFGDNRGQLGSVLASEHTKAAAAFQEAWIARAEELSRKTYSQEDGTENTKLRVDGERMEKMTFDDVYSNLHAHKDTESAIGRGFVPVIDPRCVTRPKDLGYGLPHFVQTKWGARAPLPSRSFMRIGTGPGRAIDF